MQTVERACRRSRPRDNTATTFVTSLRLRLPSNRDAAWCCRSHTSITLAPITAAAQTKFVSTNPRGCETVQAARGRTATFTTASSSKKRKLAPFFPQDGEESAASIELNTPSSPSPSSSPQLPSLAHNNDSDSQAPSPATSDTTRTTPAPTWKLFPPHVQEEVLLSREMSEGGSSPSSAFAEISIDGGSSGIKGGEQRTMSSPAQGGRSASPAKRSAADMEEATDTQQVASASFVATQADGASDVDTIMVGMTPAHSSVDTQETLSSVASTSHVTASTAPSSYQSFPPPSLPEQAEISPSTDYSMATLDEQRRKVEAAAQSELDVGQKGLLVSTKWLERVLSRTSEGVKSSIFPKEAREGLIGQIDNANIVPDGAFDEPILRDADDQEYIPLKPGMGINEDYAILPSSAWADVVQWYGLRLGQKPIARYAQNTAGPDATGANILFEIYPPVITIRKIPQPNQQSEPSPIPRGDSIREGRKRQERRGRGQNSPDDAIRLVSSRTEKFQKFLARSKEAAGISRTTKVTLWRRLDATTVTTDVPGDQAVSVAPTPHKIDTKLVLTPAEFKDMEVGKDIEHINALDHTNNDNYNGSSNMDIFGLFEDQTIFLQEQIGGSSGGDLQSDPKKRTQENDKKLGSKPASTTASRRTSPSPGAMVTRGRLRRDGRTRGTVGLTNLGNTCYMNSALQCIRSVEELAAYFLTDQYKKEINSDNPLGHHGTMAKAWAGVLAGIYNATSGVAFSPQQFKKALGNAQPLFSGYGQQDSQEFLSFLVDALHEDLNRILKKPYNENPDSDDSTVHDPQAIIELGEIVRKNHKARNDSIAMDLFSGFYKNTMECPVCDKVSINFDPFSLVTLQLPIDSTWQHRVTFIPLVGDPINHDVDIDKNATVKTLKAHVASKHAGASADRIWMAEVYSQKIYKIFEDKLSLSEAGVQSNDHIFMWELTDTPTNSPELRKNVSYYSSKAEQIPDMSSPKADTIAIPVFSRAKSRSYGWDGHLHPLYVTVSREEAKDFDVILKKVLVAVSRMTSRPILTEFDEGKVSRTKASPLANSHSEKEESAGDDTARVSDRSASSEDGYVEVTVTAPDTDDLAIGVEGQRDSRLPPPGFMHSDHPLPDSLRNSLFHMRYAKSADGPYCASMSSYETTIHDMLTRVKLASRRSSVDSDSSVGSKVGFHDRRAAAEVDESDASGEAEGDDMLKPDHVLGRESSLSLPGSDEETEAGSNRSSLPDDPLEDISKRGHGKSNKFKRNKRANGKKEKRIQPRAKFGVLRHSPVNRSSEEENLYYIKTGEAIILDWNPDAVDGLFGGDAEVADDLRGHATSTIDGKGLEYIDDPETMNKRQVRAERKKNGVTLQDCFAETGKREILSQDNAWYCNRCKEMRQAAKTLEIWTIPDILILHLKRFGGNRSFRDKIDVNVHYPLEALDMADKIGCKEEGKEYLYDLIAVDNHYGGLGGGHYTAMAKSFYDDQWYDYNGEFVPSPCSSHSTDEPDSTCSKLSEPRVQSSAAYLLFYRRRSDKPLGPPALQELVAEFRRPSASESGTGEDESGEGRLGGPTSLLHGSPSASAAGAGAEGLRSGVGTGASVDNHPTPSLTRTTQSNNANRPFIGPQRPPVYAINDPNPSWSFDSLMESTAADTTADMTSNDDNDSNAADDGDHDSAFGEGEDEITMGSHEDDNLQSAGHDSPVWYGSRDVGEVDDALHVENAGDSPAADIHLPPIEHRWSID